ncbi:MAG TPA: DUF899 family protein [Streptosporangiaceae bacterium]
MAAARRRMPWLAVGKPYTFEGPDGARNPLTLLDLFEGRQLVIYRAFFEPGVVGWPDHACHGCSLMADQVAPVAHLNARDTTFAYASRAARRTSPALGRQETWEDSPEGYPQTPPYHWWNWNDCYDHPEMAQGPIKGWD